jgi:8-oxo-dGTP diphosphatase
MLFTHESLSGYTKFKEHAVLLFLIHNQQVLLIEKLRGMGSGLVNGPGGRLEPGESYAEAAIRETQEEVCVQVHDPLHRGNLGFFFDDGYSLYGQVFIGTQFSGTPQPTAEAIPFWCPMDQVPYHRMWSDDRLWLPDLLAGVFTEGVFGFRAQTMLWAQLSFNP